MKLILEYLNVIVIQKLRFFTYIKLSIFSYKPIQKYYLDHSSHRNSKLIKINTETKNQIKIIPLKFNRLHYQPQRHFITKHTSNFNFDQPPIKTNHTTTKTQPTPLNRKIQKSTNENHPFQPHLHPIQDHTVYK